jgi:methionyl-tRNA formyltransferase
MRIALLTIPQSRRGAQVAGAIAAHGVTPDLVVYQQRRRGPVQRAADIIRPAPSGPGTAAHWARARGVATVAGDFDDPAFVRAMRERGFDLFIHAGAGILRKPLLAVPRLGTLNTHMGLLPRYRGMNVAEWAALEGEPVGVTVHLLDSGIDTGPIIATREVAVAAADVTGLRAQIDAAQLALLGEVVGDIVRTGALPRPRHQQAHSGRQYFRMHPDLKAVLERRLARAVAPTKALAA